MSEFKEGDRVKHETLGKGEVLGIFQYHGVAEVKWGFGGGCSNVALNLLTKIEEPEAEPEGVCTWKHCNAPRSQWKTTCQQSEDGIHDFPKQVVNEKEPDVKQLLTTLVVAVDRWIDRYSEGDEGVKRDLFQAMAKACRAAEEVVYPLRSSAAPVEREPEYELSDEAKIAVAIKPVIEKHYKLWHIWPKAEQQDRFLSELSRTALAVSAPVEPVEKRKLTLQDVRRFATQITALKLRTPDALSGYAEATQDIINFIDNDEPLSIPVEESKEPPCMPGMTHKLRRVNLAEDQWAYDIYACVNDGCGYARQQEPLFAPEFDVEPEDAVIGKEQWSPSSFPAVPVEEEKEKECTQTVHEIWCDDGYPCDREGRERPNRPVPAFQSLKEEPVSQPTTTLSEEQLSDDMLQKWEWDVTVSISNERFLALIAEVRRLRVENEVVKQARDQYMGTLAESLEQLNTAKLDLVHIRKAAEQITDEGDVVWAVDKNGNTPVDVDLIMDLDKALHPKKYEDPSIPPVIEQQEPKHHDGVCIRYVDGEEPRVVRLGDKSLADVQKWMAGQVQDLLATTGCCAEKECGLCPGIASHPMTGADVPCICDCHRVSVQQEQGEEK